MKDGLDESAQAERLDAQNHDLEPVDWVSLEVGEFIEYIGDDIQQAGSEWRKLGRIRRNALDSDYVSRISLEDDLDYGIEPALNRGEHRHQTVKSERITTNVFRQSMARAQQCASLRMFGAERGQQLGNEIYETEVADLEKLKKADGSKTLESAAAQLFFDVHDGFTSAIETENEMINKLMAWMLAKDSRVLHLADWMNGDGCDSTGEHKPLLEALARLFNNPSSKTFIDQKLENLAGRPELLQKVFVAQLAEIAVEGDAEDVDVSWFRFLPLLLEQSGVDVPVEKLVKAMSGIDYASLPPSVQARIMDEHREVIRKTREMYTRLLQPFIRPERFLIFDATGAAASEPVAGRKRRKGNGGRVTPKTTAPNDVAKNLEEKPLVTRAFIARKTPDGYIIQPIDSDRTELADQLLDTRIAKSYLKDYQSDPKIAEDLPTMIQAVIDEPYGAGREKMSDQIVPIRHEGQDANSAKKERVWHLNPNRCTWEGGLGATAKKTRIYYLLLPNGDGSKSFVLLDITNKNSAEQLRGSFRSTS